MQIRKRYRGYEIQKRKLLQIVKHFWQIFKIPKGIGGKQKIFEGEYLWDE